MADYISKFTGQQIDAAIQKATDIAKTATDINSNLAYTEGLKTNLNTIADNEIVSKKSDGSLQGTGILNESDKIFFPKDGRFPSGSIDIGPAATLSENGGWLQYKANTLGKDYILLDYENDETGSKRPVYWERAAEEKGHVVNNVDSTAMNNITTFNHIPTANSQVNALYLNFATDVSNFMAEIVSLNTGKPIKYIPNENAWKTNVGGLNLASGVRNILQNISPISLLTAYNLKINFKANNPINLKGDGTKPYLMVDRQLITAKPIALQGEGGGGTGSSTLLGLTDTPDSYTGKAGYLVRIKNSEDGIEFDQPPDFALPDLSNVSSSDLKKATVKAGMLQQDLEDVQLPKLKEKVEAAGANLISVGELHGDYHEGDVKEINFHNGLDVTIDSQNKIASISLFKDAFASTDLTNVKTGDLDTAIRLTNAYKQIAQKHSDTPTPSIIETGLKYLEETSSIIDWSPYSSFKFMYIAYQFDTDNQTISQLLPKVSENKAIIISNVGLGEKPLLTLTPSQGDRLQAMVDDPDTTTNTAASTDWKILHTYHEADGRYSIDNISLVANTANTITHGLGYKFVQVTVADADGKRIDVEVDYVDENTLTLTANQNVTVYGVVSI
nr:MAG: hypothetical protein [Bacteriophage sp.]